MTRLRDLVTESKYIKREFGDPLPTFNGVMEKHQVNKLKEDWWSNMSAKQQAAYMKAHPKSKQAQDAKDKEKGMDRARDLAKKGMEKGSEPSQELEKGAKVSAKWTGLSGDEQSIPDGEVIDVKHTERGMEYVISWNDGHNVIQLPADSVTSDSDDSEPEDKPHGGDTGKDADSETPKAISDAAPEVQEDIGYIHTDTKDGQELYDLMAQETLSTKDVIKVITLTGRSTHGAGPEGAKRMDNFAQSKLEVSEEEQKQNAPLGQKIAKATNGNPEDLKFVGVRSVKDKDGNPTAARSFYDKSDGMMMAVDRDGNVYENGKQASSEYKIKDSYDPKLGESLLIENPAVAAAAAMATIKLKNAQTGRSNKATTALYDKGNPSHEKAVGIFKRLKDKFTKSGFEKEKDKVAKGADDWIKKQSKSDADFYKKQYAARTGKELGEDKMNESVGFHTISGNKRFMTKTALPIMKKYGVKNVKANSVGGYFLELRFQIDSNKLKELDKELKRKNKTAYGGIVETRRDKMTEEILRKVIREEIKNMIREDEESFSQPIPAQIDRYMKKFIDAVSKGNLNRKRKLAILGRTIVALRLDPQEVSKYARLVKREL